MNYNVQNNRKKKYIANYKTLFTKSKRNTAEERNIHIKHEKVNSSAYDFKQRNT